MRFTFKAASLKIISAGGKDVDLDNGSSTVIVRDPNNIFIFLELIQRQARRQESGV